MAPVALSAIPGVAVANKILTVNRFNLWGPGKLFISMVATMIPALSTGLSLQLIERDLLLSLTPCSVCLETRAVSLQMLTGVIMPSTIGLMAANQQLVGQTWKPEWMRGICLTKKDIMKCQNIVIGNALLQAAVVSLLLYAQRKEWWHVNAELERRREADNLKRTKSSSSLITNMNDIF